MASPGPENGRTCTRTWGCIRVLPEKSWAKVVSAAKMAKKITKDDPRKIIHSFKVGLGILLVSIFYYYRCSFLSFGDNTIWAVITVVFVMEFSVGATLGKGLNRVLATLLAGALGVATHCIANLSGKNGQPVLLSVFIFVTDAAATFMRFMPPLKARYDYGLIIFILTYSLVSVSGYGESHILDVARERLLTILIGSFIAITVCTCLCPVWIGEDLHRLLAGNIEKLAMFFEGFGEEYFSNIENREALDARPFVQGYKSVLSSKSSEETMANLARWEPRHGRFRFRHPWNQYLKVGTLLRQCAYRIEALNVYLHSEQTPAELRMKIKDSCTSISSECGKALKELSVAFRKMSQPLTPNPHVENANNAAESLKAILRANPWEGEGLLEIISAAAVASLLIDIVICVEKICEAVDELACLAKFTSLQLPTEPSQLLYRGIVQPINGRDGSDHVVTVGE